MKKLLLMVFAAVSVNAVIAKDTMIIIGGGGEPEDAKETQFDGSLEGLGDFYNDNKYSYNAVVNFNGGHSTTEKKINKNFGNAEIINNFTAANYNKLIEDAIKKLSANPPQIAAGEKILLFINSHGSEKNADATHSISTSRSAMTSMNTGGSGMVSLDKLKVLADLAEKKNVKLGIIDGSCHAGNTLSLANSKTCVVAGSGPNHYSYSDFPDTYSKKMTKGKNLEEIFFETADLTEGKGFPMISTAAGISVQDELYPYLTPYMYYHDEYRGMSLDKIDNYMRSTYTPELICRKEQQYVKLTSLVNLIESMSAVEKATDRMPNSVNLSGLRKQLESYKKTQDEYFKKLSQLNLSTLDSKKEIIETDYFKKNANTKGYTHRELLSTNYEFLIQNKTAILNDPTATASKKEQARNLIDYYKAAIVIKDRVIRENPQYAQQEAIIARLRNDDDVGDKVAKGIMKEAHDAYNAYYKIKENEMIKQGKVVPNPCKDFVL